MIPLTVGIPREIKAAEKRVGLTPRGVREVKEAGIRVLVQEEAGRGSGFTDKDYQKAGAEMVSEASELYSQSGLIQKVKEPLREEWEFLNPDLILCCFLHLVSPEQKELVEILLQKSVVAIGFEAVAKSGHPIILKPMSEIAGTLAAYFAGAIRQTVRVTGGRLEYPQHFMAELESLAGCYPKIPTDLPPLKAVVYGGGSAGQRATETLLGMNSEVDLVEKNEVRRAALAAKFQRYGSRFRVWRPQDNFAKRLSEADVWIGCVHILGERAPLVLTKEELSKYSSDKPKLILDVAVDQGGNFPGTHSTTYEDPLYLDSLGNLRFGVANIPSLCGRGASEAIEETTVTYLIQLAKDWRQALIEFSELRLGLETFCGRLVNEGVAQSHQLAWQPLRPVDLSLD